MTDEEKKAWDGTVRWAESIQKLLPPVKGQTKDIADAILAADAELTALREENRELYSKHAEASYELHTLKREWAKLNNENVFDVMRERNALRKQADNWNLAYCKERDLNMESQARLALAEGILQDVFNNCGCADDKELCANCERIRALDAGKEEG